MTDFKRLDESFFLMLNDTSEYKLRNFTSLMRMVHHTAAKSETFIPFCETYLVHLKEIVGDQTNDIILKRLIKQLEDHLDYENCIDFVTVLETICALDDNSTDFDQCGINDLPVSELSSRQLKKYEDMFNIKKAEAKTDGKKSIFLKVLRKLRNDETITESEQLISYPIDKPVMRECSSQTEIGSSLFEVYSGMSNRSSNLVDSLAKLNDMIRVSIFSSDHSSLPSLRELNRFISQQSSDLLLSVSTIIDMIEKQQVYTLLLCVT